jgi:hypothetical protein
MAAALAEAIMRVDPRIKMTKGPMIWRPWRRLDVESALAEEARAADETWW